MTAYGCTTEGPATQCQANAASLTCGCGCQGGGVKVGCRVTAEDGVLAIAIRAGTDT